jgi:hypothetical protein
MLKLNSGLFPPYLAIPMELFCGNNHVQIYLWAMKRGGFVASAWPHSRNEDRWSGVTPATASRQAWVVLGEWLS